MKISDEVMAVLSTVEVGPGPAPAGSSVTITTGQLDRKLYVKTNEVLEALGGLWSRKAKAHVFPTTVSETRDRLDVAIVSGDVTTPKDLGFFPTPVEIARDLVRGVSLTKGQRVLEPSAGTGRIVDAVLDLTEADVMAVEVDTSMAVLLDQANHARRNVPMGARCTVVCRDFLSMAFDQPPFDAAIMNPPFIRGALGDHLDHVRHAAGMVKPGGDLVAILPSGVVFREDRRHREFRDWIAQLGGTIKELPEGAFRESGTGVRTVVVRAKVP